ncbi:putative RNA polymerase rbp2 [Pandoravirus japonicus]|uniref:DNA-directed RNA polymerase n=1 Tax=Pandoravirus japonicus TaxID=2823154 RepID=A0A811BS74_9VIRU|nr:putative RNA polymerase rbp2 [Pandoravirus japonicus]
MVAARRTVRVRSFDETKDGVEHDQAIGFADKGVRQCVRVYLEDGSHVDSTADHRFLCADGEWRAAKDLTGCRVNKGAEPPLIDLEAEMAALDTNEPREFDRSMALFRILGWVLTDGHIPVNKQDDWVLYMDHEIDANTMLDDIELLSGRRPPMRLSPDRGYGSSCHIRLPAAISELLENFADDDIIRDRRATQPARWPAPLLSAECPLPLLREFVAALFGGDGTCPYLAMHRGKRDQLTSIGFSQSKVKRHVASLEALMGQLKAMLVRLGIEASAITIRTSRATRSRVEFAENGYVPLHPDRDFYEVHLHIDVSQLEAFHDRIGFRHCAHKATRLEAAVSYYRLRRNVQRQTNWVVERVKQLSGTTAGLNGTRAQFIAKDKVNTNQKRRQGRLTMRQAVRQAHAELRAIEPVYNDHYSLPNCEMIVDRLKVVRKNGQAPKMAHKHFPKAADYLKSIGADLFFTGDNDKLIYGVGRDRDTLPAMRLKVLDVRPIGDRAVYDIEVAKNHNFLANGVVAHNCIISHGASQFLLERLFEQSDAYSTVVCAACGLLAIPAKPKNAPVVGMAVRGYDEPHCRVCDTGAHVREVKMPYACKLLVQELMACCVAFRFRFDAPPTTTTPRANETAAGQGHDRECTKGDANDDGDDMDECIAPRIEGAGPDGSVLAALPLPAVDGILGRIETLLRAAGAAPNKRKRDDDRDGCGS